ncbi:heavy metal translocating P-type ATPase [Lactococcus ileimucosae]|uniref:heavy metal translocating P-type ATPase n=1 Tax=Lactococcus ileimucosae TaxID=2941329 RepID=UPI0020438FB1|nr:cation-translocating P-type ATPase [Lactococcus ileimucosae]
MKSQNFVITGMTCANCANTVSKALNSSDKIKEATVNLATEKAKVIFDDNISDQEVIKIVEKVGYGAIVNDKKHQEKIAAQARKRDRNLRLSLVVATVLTLPLVIAMFEGLLGTHYLMFLHDPVLQLILATPVQFIIGWRFYVGSYHALKNGNANMDVLVALGTSVAYFSSLVLAVFMGQKNALHFESAMVIITLVVLGKVLEHNAKEKTTQAITRLMSSRVKMVHTEDGDVPLEQVQIGDVIQVFPGEKVPLDAMILKGKASFDESHLTGEALPVVKGDDETLFEGTVNLDGSIKAVVVRDVNDSTISRMVELMEEAQASKPDIQKFADRLSNVFVPIVLVISLLTFIVTWAVTGVLLTAIMHAVATLVIACPCALGLATPTAIISGTGLAAKNGLLLKNANALELTNTVKTVFFDKTGTITTGEFELSNFDGSAEDFKILASLEKHSNHPLAQAVKAEKTYDVENLKEIAGRGLSAEINGRRYFAGNAKLMEEQGLQFEESTDTVIYLADDEKLRATATFKSAIKAESVQTVAELKKAGIRTVMLTGDNANSAKKIQKIVNLDEVRSNLSPEDKAQIVQDTPHSIMVGDGINDAIALASSTVGVAMATGSDIAMEAGDVTIMGGKIHKLIDLFTVSRKTLRKIKQNYFWAFIYNIIGIPLAAFGLLNPMVAAAAMSLSSVSVILNSLLLTKAKL